jgi:hypothetical protein
MGAEIVVAGFRITAEEWERFEPDFRAELAGAAGPPADGDDELDAADDVLR